VVFIVLNTCVQVLYDVFVVWSGLSSWLVLWLLICGLVQVVFFIPVLNFSIAILLLLPSDWICSQAHVLTSYSACVAVIENSSI